MLRGIPVIASSGIGDTDKMLSGLPFAYILNDYSIESLDEAVSWILKNSAEQRRKAELRSFGVDMFGLQRSISSYYEALKKLA